MLEPEYGENIITGVIFENKFRWYITNKLYWIMDMRKLIESYENLGYEVNPNIEQRFGIEVLSELNANEFLENIKHFEISVEELKNRVKNLVDEQNFYDLEDYVPSILVNFDEKKLISIYPEYISFEEYVPDNWEGEFNNFLSQIPEKYRYWSIYNEDLFKKYL